MRFELGNPDPLVDEPIGFAITGLAPNASLVVRAQWELAGIPCESTGHFLSPANGIVSPGTDPGVGGTYLGVEPHGLWWSARPDGELGVHGLDPIDVTVQAETESDSIEARVTRHLVAPGVTVEVVRDDGLVGTYFRPPGDDVRPATLVVGGSGGGLLGADTTAALLASRGIPSLALAYFGLPGLPEGLARVPLEYFGTALRWLARRPDTSERVAVLGQSRGVSSRSSSERP